MKPVVIKLGVALWRAARSRTSPAFWGQAGRSRWRTAAASSSPGCSTLGSRFHEGLRVTDLETLEVAEMVFAGA